MRLRILLGCNFLWIAPTAYATIRVSVQDENNHIGVWSEVFLQDASGRDNRLGETNRAGEKKFHRDCKKGEFVEARPISRMYFFSRPIECKKHIELFVSRKGTAVDHLSQKGELLLKSGEFQRAALDFARLAQSAAEENPDRAAKGTERAYYAASRVFNVSMGTRNAESGEFVPSPELARRLTELQLRFGLPVSGRLDIETAKAMVDEKSPAP